MKSAIEDVFKRVTIMSIHVHPGSFFSIIDGEFGRSNESAGEFAVRENPTKLDAEDQKEAVDGAKPTRYRTARTSKHRLIMKPR